MKVQIFGFTSIKSCKSFLAWLYWKNSEGDCTFFRLLGFEWRKNR